MGMPINNGEMVGRSERKINIAISLLILLLLFRLPPDKIL